MKPKFEVQIADPCHENWDIMSHAEKGRFCDVCSKVVVDFTAYSDEQLIEYFSNRKNNNEKLCGRFHADNVKVPQKIEVPEQSYYQLNSGIQRFLWLLLVSLGFVVVSCTDNAVKGEIEQRSVMKKTEAQVLVPMESQSPDSLKNKPAKTAPLKTKKIQNCGVAQLPVELMGEPMDIIMGGITPPERVSPEIIKVETVIGDTIIREQHQPIIKGKVAIPRSLPPKSIMDTSQSKRGE